MKWVSALSETKSVKEAVTELSQTVKTALPDGVDLALLFVSPYFKNDFEALPGWVMDQLGCQVLVGCSAGGVIGDGREVERRPAISIIAASLPDVTITPFHLDQSALPDLDASPKKWQALFQVEENNHFILLADPFTLDVEHFLQGLDYAYPNSAKVGGLSSGSNGAGQGGLFLNRTCYRSGVIGVALSGAIAIDTIVAQGCRPIGRPLAVTQCDRNMLIEVDGQKPIEVLQSLYQELPESDQRLIQHSLFIGLANTPFKETLSRGDFLIRNLMGIDSKTGAIAIGTLLHEGRTIQFHLRDKETSSEDLKWHLEQYQLDRVNRPSTYKDQEIGVLLFSCSGRGAHLYGEPNVDSNLVRDMLGPVPLGGFFCSGEIGVVGQATFLHGYTSCLGVVRPL